VTRPSIEWDCLLDNHPEALVNVAKRLFSDGGPFEISADTMSSETSCSTTEAEKLLINLCPPLEKISVLSCRNCNTGLSRDDSRLEVCPNCRQQYAEYGGIQASQVFAFRDLRSRDVSWVLALHGMNTDGAWQEQFNWRVSNAYTRSIPVAIYKYGWVTSGAVWRPSLRAKVKRVVSKIRKLQGDTVGNGFGGTPDVIAHSLGTWLIGHALQWNPTLKVGRVILTGSILRPDFDWGRLISQGQVEAVLNHYGTKDFWARVTHYVIPDSGPSGRYGFNSTVPVAQVRAERYGHSDVFRERNLPTVFETVWRPFLTQAAEDLKLAPSYSDSEWREAPWIWRATIVPLMLLAIFWICLGTLVFCCLLGLHELGRWL
jgi:hypothetical protein